MKFVFPDAAYRDRAVQFIDEFDAFHSNISGCAALDQYLKESTYEEWLEHVSADTDGSNTEMGKVPSYTYFYVREEDEKIIGMVNIRLALDDFLRKEGGHIGYCIRPTERNRHYATNLLEEAVSFCRMLGLEDIILTCGKNNIASACVIKNCGGILEEEFYSETFQETLQRYIIR